MQVISATHETMSTGQESIEQRQMRKVAFFAIVISTAAVVCSIVTLPMLYNYVASFQSHLATETEFCKSRSRDMWQEIQMLLQVDSAEHHHGKRAAPVLYGQPSLVGYGSSPTGPMVQPTPSAESSCCACQQGPPGPIGEPGDDGSPGLDGKNGSDGDQGKDGSVLTSALPPNQPCILCPAGIPGPVGQPGNKGPQGPKGMPGEKADDGKEGMQGLAGPQGMPGPIGPPGPVGPQGAPGKVFQVNGPAGESGPPGEQGGEGPKGEPGPDGVKGPIGEQGPPGDDGGVGPQGKPGQIGMPGPQGPVGESGPCDHCPQPRTPPGY